MATYTPSQEILEKYAKVLVNFALNSGKGIKKGDVVRLAVSEAAKPMYVSLRNQIIRSGGIVISDYTPSDVARDFFQLSSIQQLQYFPAKYMKGLIDQIDHSIGIIADTDLHELEGIDPKKIMARNVAFKPFHDWRTKKENAGKFTWTLGLYGTPAMAKEAGITIREYWQQIIKACFLDEVDPIAKWREVFKENERIRSQLNSLSIEKLHLESKGTDLWVKLGSNRKWLGGSGRNIPSFELFISPDWRGTSGTVTFSQPLYYYGNLIKGIRLEFKDGQVVKSSAKKNYPILKEMISTKNADKIGEFSLTDKRMSRIDKFMAETLFDENISGPFGNFHIALGSAYKESYFKDPAKVTSKAWDKLGFNDSAVHTDIISTTDRVVTAYFSDGSQKIIYKSGQFTL